MQEEHSILTDLGSFTMVVNKTFLTSVVIFLPKQKYFLTDDRKKLFTEQQEVNALPTGCVC